MSAKKEIASLSVCEEQLYKQLFDKHSDPIYYYLFHKYNKEHLAKDAMQDAYIKLWQKCKDVPLQNAKAFLYKVANNKMLDLLKRNNKSTEFTEANNQTHDNNPEYMMEYHDFKTSFDQVLQQMPQNYKIPFLLNRIEDKTYKEIAETLDISVKAVEKRMYKALLYLKEHLQVDEKLLKRK